MKLQIKDSGSWRHMLSFDKNVEAAVRERAAKLMVVVHDRITLRILDENNAIRAFCSGPDFSWEDQSM